MRRRDFLNLLLAGGFSVITKVYPFSEDGSFRADPVVPPFLKKGSKVAFTAPGSPVSTWQIRQIANFFHRQGCSIYYGETITKRDIKQRYLSRDDKFRAEEINSLFADTSVDCIVAARGGFGSIRVLDLLDYDLIKRNPKIFLGFSDITVILLALYKKSNLVTFHGPTGNFNLDSFTSDILKTLLFEKSSFKDYCIYYNFAKSDILN
ncbi:MAG: LD-carboxypeptidase, partial [Candidatus Kapaibacteriota bacterium]